VPYERLADPEPGWKRFRLGLRDATEFLLRKDYRKSWDVELHEEYTYFSQADFERELSARGLRISYAAEITNPWITQHRYEGKIRISDLEGNALPFPPTNVVVVGTKVTLKDGVRFAETSREELHNPSFITLRCFKNKSTGEVFELASRPRPTLDLIPWYEEGGEIMVLAKTEYPRPIITTKGRALDGSTVAGYIAEPINAVVQDLSGKSITETLKARTGLEETSLLKLLPGLHYFPSPGATDQRAKSVLAQIEPPQGCPVPPQYSGFSTSGTIKPVEVQQILRSAQVGAMFDSRLEINAYHLLLSLQHQVGPWIGSELSLEDQLGKASVFSANEVLHREPRHAFVEVDSTQGKGFFQLMRSNFEELNQAGTVISSHPLEYASPARLSDNTVAVVPLAKSGGEVLIGLEERDLPAGTARGEGSDLITCPCFRIPREFDTLEGAKAWALGKLEKEFGVKVKGVRELGGRYYPSAGLLPEVVYPYVVEIALFEGSNARSHLTWVPLRTLAERYREIHDAHLLTGTLRAAHALGLLGRDDHERRIAA
jgi:hypothetical protein